MLNWCGTPRDSEGPQPEAEAHPGQTHIYRHSGIRNQVCHFTVVLCAVQVFIMNLIAYVYCSLCHGCSATSCCPVSSSVDPKPKPNQQVVVFLASWRRRHFIILSRFLFTKLARQRPRSSAYWFSIVVSVVPHMCVCMSKSCSWNVLL